MKNAEISIASNGQRYASLAWEDAMTAVSEMKEMSLIQGGSADIYSGCHPHMGTVSIVVSSSGQSTVLYPFDNRLSLCQNK